MAKAVAKMTYAFANATVPKVNVIVGSAYGSAYLAMNSKSIGADMVYAWSGSQIGMMDAKLAAKIMYADSDAALPSMKRRAEYAHPAVPAYCPRQKEDMWIPSSRRRIPENM